MRSVPFLCSDRLTFGPSFPDEHDCLPLPIVLSTLTKLKDIEIWYDTSVGWITDTLNTITSKHLRQISLRPRHPTSMILLGGTAARDQAGGSWLGLARVLLKFSESHSIRSKIYCQQPVCEVEAIFKCLLPESSGNRVVDLRPCPFKRLSGRI